MARCPRKNFGMAAVESTLVIVGGADASNKKSNKVAVWDATSQWKENYYPSLLQARAFPDVAVYKKWLLVIGGMTDKALNAIEKFDLESHKPAWSLCVPLPDKCTEISSVVIEHTLYVAGTAANGASELGKAVYSVLLPLLIRIKAKDTSVWEKLPNIPNPTSSLCSMSRKTLLAFGGEVDPVSSLAMLSPVYSLALQEGGIKWERVGSLPFERNCCTCLRVGMNKVVVLGGTQLHAQEGLRRVDMGTV